MARIKRIIPTLMILLIITMPIYVAMVFAEDSIVLSGVDSVDIRGDFGRVVPVDKNAVEGLTVSENLLAIKSVDISGADGYPGFRKDTDTTVVKVRLDPDLNGVSAEQVWLGIMSQFDSCQGTAQDDYECIVTADQDTLESRDHSYNIYYYNDTYLETVEVPSVSQADDSRTATILVDSKAPLISTFEANPRSVGTGDIRLSYIATDRSCNSERCSNYCVGMKQIEFFAGNSSLQTEQIDQSGCLISGTIIVPTEGFDEGETELKAVATDLFEQSSTEKKVTVTVDRSAPAISDVLSVTLDGEEVDYLSSNESTLVFSVAVEDADLTSVIGDFSQVNGESNKTAVCAVENSSNVCKWTNVKLTLSEPKDLMFRVIAEDELGNLAVSDFTYHIDVDSTGPAITGITTDNDPYLSENGTVTVTLREEGAGLYQGNIYLDLTGIGGGVVKADSCSEGWTCVFTGIDSIVEGRRYIAVSQSSTDDMGNPVTGAMTKLVTNDKTPPLVVETNIAFIPGTYPLVGGQPTTGASMEISATVREESQLGAVADLSSFVEGVSALPGSCEQEGELWNCVWQTPPIDRSGPYTADVKLVFSDILGNNITRNIPVKVIGLDTDTLEPNYWASNVVCSPSLVDRDVTPHIDMKVYCSVTLDSNNAQIVNMDMAGCYEPSSTEATGLVIGDLAGQGWVVDGEEVGEGEGEAEGEGEILDLGEGGELSSVGPSASSYVASTSLVNDVNSTTPIIEIVLARTQMNINKLSLVCPFNIVSQVGDTVVLNPEVEEAKVNIYFYNNPEGEFGENIDDKIENAKKKAEGFWNILGWLHKIFFWAKKICNILYTINRVVVTFKAITDMSATASIAAQGTPAFPFVESQRQALCQVDSEIADVNTYMWEPADKFCQFINCQMGRPDYTPKKEEPKKEGKGGLLGGLGNIRGSLGGIGNGIRKWQDWGFTTLGKADVGDFIKDNTGRDPRSYMNARDNLVVAILTGCIPGIIAGVEKIRQIECMYGYCLQEGVKGNGVPISACEDQKDYAYCKYIFGEIFALIPFTAFFDYFFGMIKSALSDPLTALSIPFAYVCKPICIEGAYKWKADMEWCGWIQVASLIGEIVGQVQAIINADAWTVQNDYCKKLTDEEEEESYAGGEALRANQGAR